MCTVIERVEIKERIIGRKFWWDKKRNREERTIRKAHRKWRKRKSYKNSYIKLKRKFKRLCKKKEGRNLRNKEDKTEKDIRKYICIKKKTENSSFILAQKLLS